MKRARKKRSDEELKAILLHDPELKVLHEWVCEQKELDIDPDGVGECIFKVYFRGERAANMGFLRIFSPIDKSYVHWHHVPVTHGAFAHLVREPSRPAGSKVKLGTSVEELQHALLDCVRLHLSRSE
jgi:hypothetical protein